MTPTTDLKLGGHLNLKVPATVEADCSCFCFKKKVDEGKLIIHQDSIVRVKKATPDQTQAAVNRVVDEVIRRCHPHFGRATDILKSVGIDPIAPPRFLTADQVESIRTALEHDDSSSVEPPARPNSPSPEAWE